MREIILEDGKYRFWKPDTKDDSNLYCDRFGEPWGEFIGDKAVSALFDIIFSIEKDKHVQTLLRSNKIDNKSVYQKGVKDGLEIEKAFQEGIDKLKDETEW